MTFRLDTDRLSLDEIAGVLSAHGVVANFSPACEPCLACDAAPRGFVCPWCIAGVMTDAQSAAWVTRPVTIAPASAA